MKRNLLNRYEKDSSGNIFIDVSAKRVEDLYNNFDRKAPYIRRDLDQDLAEYLVECARELAGRKFTVRFSLTHTTGKASLIRIKRSIKSYFLYMVESEKRNVSRKIQRSLALFALGLVLLFAATSTGRIMDTSWSVLDNVLAEGLMVAAWVALWEAIAIFIMGWIPHRRNIRIYRMLSSAPLQFQDNA